MKNTLRRPAGMGMIRALMILLALPNSRFRPNERSRHHRATFPVHDSLEGLAKHNSGVLIHPV
jgi:hypothetical protein